MSIKLVRPRDPKQISECSPGELMRVEVGGQPGVGMVVGQGSSAILLFIDKEGVVHQRYLSTMRQGSVVFIDYLLENESVTIFGSCSERSEDVDLAHMPASPAHLPYIEAGTIITREIFDLIPAEQPFHGRHRNESSSEWKSRPSMHCIVADARGEKVGFLGIGVTGEGLHSHSDMPYPVGGNYRFDSWALDEETRETFKAHQQRRRYRES
jgi:hypothetical protein